MGLTIFYNLIYNNWNAKCFI